MLDVVYDIFVVLLPFIGKIAELKTLKIYDNYALV